MTAGGAVLPVSIGFLSRPDAVQARETPKKIDAPHTFTGMQ
jgi:hypothetical protein